MLRKGIIALMMTIMCAGVNAADDSKPNALLGFLKGPSIGRPHRATSEKSGGVRHAVVDDAETQVPEIRQTSAAPQAANQPIFTPPRPVPVPHEAGSDPRPPVISYGSGTSTVPARYTTHQGGLPVQAVGYPRGGGIHHLPVFENTVPMGGGSNAALYPAPQSGIPAQVGGTAIVNHAFHPHEMMYPHKYKAMYGPYYYKVHGKWVVTPFGVWSRENWKLQGTQVEVKYKSHISPFARFHPPVIR